MLLRPPLSHLLLTFGLLLPVASAQPPGSLPSIAPAAATSTPAAAMSLSDLLLALRQSPNWQAADLTYRASELALQAARIRAGVSLSASGTLGAAKVPWDSGEWVNTSSLTLNVGANVLPWSPAQLALQSAARAQQAAALELRRTRADLTLGALRAYSGVVQAQQALALAGAQQKLAQRLFGVAEAQRAAQTISAEALLQRQTDLQNAEAGVGNAERAVQSALSSLQRLLGREVSGVTPLTTEFTVTDLNEAALLSRALATRPEIARAELAVADAQASLQTARRELVWPDLSVSGQFGQLGSIEGTAGKRVSGSLNLTTGVASAQVALPLADTSKLPTGAALNLSATVPLLGRTQSNALEQAQLALTQARLAVDNARAGITLEVRSRLNEYLDEVAAKAALDTSLRRAQTLLSTAQARLEAGTATALEVEQAQLGVQQASNALQAAADRRSLAALNLMQATGDLDPLLLAPLPSSLTLPTGGQP